MQASVLHDASTCDECVRVHASADREWLDHCMWSPILSVVAMNRSEWERRCERCKARVGIVLADPNANHTNDLLQGQLEWDAELGGGC